MRLDVFTKRINQAAADVSEPHAALQRIAHLVEGSGKQNAPVRTGTLRRSITSRVDSATTARVGSNLEYAPYVHEGTKYMKAQPFLRDAIDQNRDGIERALQEFGQSVFRKVAR